MLSDPVSNSGKGASASPLAAASRNERICSNDTPSSIFWHSGPVGGQQFGQFRMRHGVGAFLTASTRQVYDPPPANVGVATRAHLTLCKCPNGRSRACPSTVLKQRIRFRTIYCEATRPILSFQVRPA